MRSIYAQNIFTSALACFGACGAYAGESAALLSGAETYNLKVGIYSDQGCAIDQRALTAVVQRRFGKAPKLRAVDEQAIPDIILTLTVDIAAIPPSEAPEMCLYNVNARAIHPMYGKLRYSENTRVIRALTFNKSMFSVIVPSKLQAAVEIQSGKVLDFFFDEYVLGNPYP